MLRDAKIRSLKERAGDAQYCGAFECAYPVYECELELRMLALEKLSAIEEYVLNALSLGGGTVSGIDLVLGLGLPASRRAVAELLAADLLEDDRSSEGIVKYVLTEAGGMALQQVAVPRTITVALNCIVDAVTGDVSIKPSRARYLAPDRVSEAGLIILPSSQDAPSVDGFDLRRVNELVRDLGRRDPDRWPKGEVLDLQKIARSHRRFRRLDVVVFERRDGNTTCYAFERHGEQRELSRVLGSWLSAEPGLLPVDRNANLPVGDEYAAELTFLPPEVVKEAAEVAEQALVLEEQIAAVEAAVEAIKEAPPEGPSTREQLATLEGKFAQLNEQYSLLQSQIEQRVKKIGTAEHRPLLERAFKHAKEQIIVVSPWIARDAVIGDFEAWLFAALRRGVRVRIGWGFSDQTRDQPKEQASKEIADYLMGAVAKDERENGRANGKLEIVRLGNSHEKVLIADTNFCVVTSFNWLSFKGDKRRKHRRETGARIGIPPLVAQWRKDFEDVLDAAKLKS